MPTRRYSARRSRIESGDPSRFVVRPSSIGTRSAARSPSPARHSARRRRRRRRNPDERGGVVEVHPGPPITDREAWPRHAGGGRLRCRAISTPGSPSTLAPPPPNNPPNPPPPYHPHTSPTNTPHPTPPYPNPKPPPPFPFNGHRKAAAATSPTSPGWPGCARRAARFPTPGRCARSRGEVASGVRASPPHTCGTPPSRPR